jgi:Zn-dependent peptidase ImmA (M78 family)
MTSYRDAVLEGVRVAAELLDDLDLRKAMEAHPGQCIDVIGAIVTADVPVLFRPMEKLLGACVRVDNDARGILVTTQRDLHIQRFTAAHELGHLQLGHRGSFDFEDDIGFLGRTTSKNLDEVAADSFAAAFLAPKWLVRQHCQRQHWSEFDVRKPTIVYQLSLRLGISYLATCWTLQSHNIIRRVEASGLRDAIPKEAKRAVLLEVPLADPWADVWNVSARDHGGVLVAGPTDLMNVELIEHAASGFEWDESRLAPHGFRILLDTHAKPHDSVIGDTSPRRLVLSVPPFEDVVLRIEERRPWDENVEPMNVVDLRVSTHGKETTGIPRRLRPSGGQ